MNLDSGFCFFGGGNWFCLQGNVQFNQSLSSPRLHRFRSGRVPFDEAPLHGTPRLDISILKLFKI